MHNVFLDPRTAADIDRRLTKIIRDLGNPEPPLHLELVRELLTLDHAYYSKSDDGALRETVHRLKMAGKQVVKRPSLLLDVVRKKELKALWLPDRRRILIDRELPPAKQRWAEAHEVGHSIIPWHEDMMHGDMQRTLSISCEHELEAEANYAAGRLLFLQDLFREHVCSAPVSFAYLKELSRKFGNTITSTLWRLIEVADAPTFGMVSKHPRIPLLEEQNPVRYFIRSRTFIEQFSSVSKSNVFEALGRFCHGSVGPIGSDEVPLLDIHGVEHVFFAEAFFNHHEVLTLGAYRGVRPLLIGTTGKG